MSAPLTDLINLATGGDGSLSGNLDEIVIVIAGVAGGADSTVELDLDYFAFTSGGPLGDVNPPVDPSEIVDNYETELPEGFDENDVAMGFFTFSDGSAIAVERTDAPPAPVPGSEAGNNVLCMTGDVTAFAGFIHFFTNAAADTWVPQDWSSYEGMRLWVYGQNSGTTVFIDVADNRAPDSTSDDAERFSVSFIDDFSGWQQLEFPFASFVRKEIGNGAPNDDFNLTQVHGYAIGTLDTPGELSLYFDDIELYGEAVIPDLAVTFTSGRYDIEEGTTGEISVKLNRAMNSEDPAQVSIDFLTEPGVAIPGREYVPTNGTLTFVNGGLSTLTFPLETIDDTKWEGDERIVLRLANPVDVALGFATQSSAFIQENDPYDPDLIEDFQNGAFMWEGNSEIATKEIEADDSGAIPGQDPYETVLNVTPAEGGSSADAPRSELIQLAADLEALLPTGRRALDNRINQAINFINNANDDAYWDNDYFPNRQNGINVFSNNARAAYRLKLILLDRRASDELKADVGELRDALLVLNGDLAQEMVDIANDNEGNARLIRFAERNIRNAERQLSRNNYYGAIFEYGYAWRYARRAVRSLDLTPFVPSSSTTEFGVELPSAKDWSLAEGMSFYYYGQNTGEAVTVELLDNRAPDPGPDGWGLVWSEEFNEPAGTVPNPDNWTYEIGDVTPDGKNGWGNDERQYYTDDPANAATDGNGNMVLTLREDTSGRECYYGTCEYTSARLISWRKAEFAYGRIDSRIRVPEGQGIWPAFWSLGTDIDLVSWPQTGEIDFMEFVGRLPNEIFGTVHGPGYSGGASVGNVYDFGEPVYTDFHTYTVEWEPGIITWYVDGIQYHQVTPEDVPGEWVFEDEVFLLLNVAIGGNFGGAIDPDIPLPAAMEVDYIRVYQGPDTAERFETTFVEDFEGWQEVTVPFSSFERSAEQPEGAPDDGLTLTGVRGYGFEVPTDDDSDPIMLDQVRLAFPPKPTEIEVTTLADGGEGSLRAAIAGVATDGVITFNPSLADGTIALTSGQLQISNNVTIDGSGAPGLVVSGNNASRVFQIAAAADVSMNDLAISDGVGAPQGGGILNFGTLNLDTVTISNNTETSDGPASFDLGGGAIYNGDGATMSMTNSTVRDNASLNQPGGGIYGFFNSTIVVDNSTISGNVSGDVAGGFRTLGDVTVTNSTISGNTSTGWHGGGMFVTNGNITILNTTITANNSPADTAGGLMVASFGDPVNATIQNTIIADNGSFGCQVEGGGAVLTSLGNNVATDATCAPEASDAIVASAGLEALADNGGPTATHALSAGSSAIDAANGAVCPPTDQRGVARPQGAGCDAGSYEAD
ncbi:MAG: carbohydrate binding domain-containing protein [Chloroflexota bacterium]